jgi:phosphonate transport system ATP-binding protein
MAIALEGVGLTHANGFVALRDIALAVKPGEHVALIGPSGAGKSTLLSVLATGVAPSTGNASLLGNDLRMFAGAPLQALRRRIGMVYQAPPIPGQQRAVTAVGAGRLGQWPFWKSVVSLVYPLDLGGVRAALERVQLADKLFVRCDQLSGGQLQRIGIARVLYQQAELMLADEPVSALDPSLALATVQLLTKDAMDRGATLVASLHAVDLALRCFPRIVGIKAGQIAFDLPAVDVTEATLQTLYGSENPHDDQPGGA